jgi:DNA-binding IclR family transcriptional regulator
METEETPGPSSRRNASGLGRDVEILELLAGHPGDGGLGVMRVAQLLGRDKATVSRALSTLADAGLVERDRDTLGYRLGHRIYAMAALTAEAALSREVQPFLRHLARQSRETVHLSVLRGDVVLTLLSELSPNEVRTASWAGRRTDALLTPSGRVLVSDWSDAELADWYAEHEASARRRAEGGDALVDPDAVDAAPDPDPDEPAPPWLRTVDRRHRVFDLPTLIAETRRIRARGFATAHDEFEPGVAAASAPVRDHADRVVAALNVSAPVSRIGGHVDRLGVYVGRAANRISVSLGAPAREIPLPLRQP